MKTFSIILLLGLVVLMTACSNDGVAKQPSEDQSKDTAQAVSLLSPEEFMALHNQTMEAILLDVRTPQEYAQGAIEGSINRDYHAENFEILLNSLNRKYPIFVYCQSGTRSSKTCEKLKDMGFTKVYEMEGGYPAYVEWEATQPKPE